MIGQILKAMRKNKKLMQNEISEMTNIPQNTISQYETGKIQPTFEIIEKIATACDYKIIFKNKNTNDEINTENIGRKI